MLKLIQPDSTMFHNFKCGEIFCLNPNNYNVTCCLCGFKVPFEQFPQHFQGEHLSEAPMQMPPFPKTLDHKEETVCSTDTEFVRTGEDPIKSEQSDNSDDDGARIDANFANPMNDVLEDEQPIDFDALNLLQDEPTGDVVKIEKPPTSNEESNRSIRLRREAAVKSEKSTDPDWHNNDSSDDDSNNSNKANDIDSLPYPCPDCMRSYKTKRSMMAHHRQSHNPKRQSKSPNLKYKCDECGELFRSERNLRGHRWKHTGIVCDICGKTFSQAGNLSRHKIRHTGIKAHKCKECGNDFFTDKELKAHMLRHTGERPVVCEICGRRCRDHGVYKAHMRRHTGERPAKCEVCGKAFYSFHDLNVHAVTHSTARPFACDTCGSTFQRKKSLRVHKKLHSKDRNHECKVCGKAFAQSGGLHAHMRTHDAALSKTIGLSTNNKAATISDELMGVNAGVGVGVGVAIGGINDLNAVNPPPNRTTIEN